MANTSARGGLVERRAITILESQGYKVHRCMKTVVRTRFGFRTIGQDVFGCIDLVAKKADEPMTRWIQVTSTSITRKVADLAHVPWNVHDSVEVWRWVGGKGKRIDARNGKPRPRMYFQVYHRSKDFVPEANDRIHVEAAAAPPGRVAASGPGTMHATQGMDGREFEQPTS
ncbi:MAG: hypothetical protein AABY18_04750 [Candidatus Thermoplasmatota archaeon]